MKSITCTVNIDIVTCSKRDKNEAAVLVQIMQLIYTDSIQIQILGTKIEGKSLIWIYDFRWKFLYLHTCSRKN